MSLNLILIVVRRSYAKLGDKIYNILVFIYLIILPYSPLTYIFPNPRPARPACGSDPPTRKRVAGRRVGQCNTLLLSTVALNVHLMNTAHNYGQGSYYTIGPMGALQAVVFHVAFQNVAVTLFDNLSDESSKI